MTMHSLLRQYENKTKDCVWSYVNLLQYTCRENLTCFGHLLWPSSQRCFPTDILQRDVFVLYRSGRNMWKVYDTYIVVNSHNFIWTRFYFHRKLSTKSCLYFKNSLYENQNIFIQLNCISGVPRGRFGVVQPSPRNLEGPPKSCQTQSDCENC